jgi:hypothetical protein
MSEAPDRSRSWESTPACRQLRAARGLRSHGGGFVRIVEMCGERTAFERPSRLRAGRCPRRDWSAQRCQRLRSPRAMRVRSTGSALRLPALRRRWSCCRARLRVGDNSESRWAPAPCLALLRDRGLVVGRGLRSSCSLRLVAAGMSRLLKGGVHSASSLSLSDRGYAARPINKGQHG